MSAASTQSAGPTRRQTLWLVLALSSLAVLFQHYGIPFLPPAHRVIAPSEIQPLGNGASAAYLFAFTAAAPDRPHNPVSRVRLFQDGKPLEVRTFLRPRMYPVRNGAWAHTEGMILFSALDNSDPRDGRHEFSVSYPRFGRPEWGWGAALVFILATIMLWRGLAPPFTAAVPPARPPGNWPWHLAGVSLLLLAGLYCNTGTLAPYANTAIPRIDVETGYLYSVDHGEFRALYHFINGEDRRTWEHALLLRRILYPIVAWPLMRAGGFELGGTLTSLLLTWGGVILIMHLLRRQVGQRGALLAGWLLALYPGAAYWGGLPYLYSAIVPGSLLLMAGLVELAHRHGLRHVTWLSLALGLGYLAYDFAVLVLPASLLILAWQRQWKAVAVSAACQVLPLALWLAALRFIFVIPPLNSNTGVYATLLGAYLAPGDLTAWAKLAADAPTAAWNIWFGANFQFLPLLGLAVLAINPLTSRIRPALPELALLAVALALFLATNLAPPQNTQWNMRGAWISRLYQPILPVCLYWCARWWQALPPLRPAARRGLWLLLGAVGIGNALIIFGPLLGNPGQVSGDAFYRFYTHTDIVLIRSYDVNLATQGRRPLGFPARPAP